MNFSPVRLTQRVRRDHRFANSTGPGLTRSRGRVVMVTLRLSRALNGWSWLSSAKLTLIASPDSSYRIAISSSVRKTARCWWSATRGCKGRSGCDNR